ncbi:hypothetical protein ANCDUO_01904 [Ancylostoma duodenale]|uniref:Peptidase M13 N-terminal domain-containing protein n=1 Tax=Ancylostoma duodenale TaxID=51022 RepID=A0A0C2HDX5_9BILA|nr:hypothetical protein ANCDUO_01904 [Ancylostoma duodenale]
MLVLKPMSKYKASKTTLALNTGEKMYLSLIKETLALDRSHVTQLLQDADLPTNSTKIASDVDEIIDLETELAKIIVPEENRRDFSKMYNIRRLSDMQKIIPSVDWARYFHSIAPVVVHDYLASNPEILVAEIDYMRRSAFILKFSKLKSST